MRRTTDFSEIDARILHAIQSYQGVPTEYNLSKEGRGPLEYNRNAIRNGLKRNPRLQEALDSKGLEFVQTCDRVTFDRNISSYQWVQATGKIREAIDKRLDAFILEAIQAYPGVPNTYNIGKEGGGPLEYSKSTIIKRMKSNPLLQGALESKSLEFVKTCDRATFDKIVTARQWVKDTGAFREAINMRLDPIILEVIRSYPGVPAIRNLGKPGGGPLEYGEKIIADSLKRNPRLQAALDLKGLDFVQTCDREIFIENLTSCRWTNVTDIIRDAINKRLDPIIVETIQAYPGIPTAYTLAKSGGGPLDFSPDLVRTRIKCNPTLQDALESKGLNFIKTCDRASFDKNITTMQWNNATGIFKDAIHERLDAIILEAIRAYPGVPSANNLSKKGGGPLEYGHKFVKEQLERNPRLQEALDSKGLEFVQTCDRVTFDRNISSYQWVQATGKIREAIDKRLDAFILEAIQAHPGLPNPYNLSKAGGGQLDYYNGLIRERLKSNPELRKALYLKRGLTEDRINALEVESDAQSPALIESVRRRLPNIRVFREAIGLLKQFLSVFRENTIEVSFYPEPLSKASALLGLQAAPTYVPAHGLKRPDFQFEPGKTADTLILLQCCHRLENEALVNAFNEANRILSDAGELLVTLPHEFSKTDLFGRQVQDFGFELKTEGELHMSTLTTEELAALGIPEPGRLKQKVEQTTNVLMFVKTKPAEGKTLDDFVLPKTAEGNGVFVPSTCEVDTPPEILRGLSAAFRERKPDMGNGFMLTVLDDETYVSRDLIAFDMSPTYPGKVEICPSIPPALSKSELRRVFKSIGNPAFREKALIREGYESRVPARNVRMALG